MMLEPDPQLRATAEALLALPMLRQPRPWNVLWCVAAEALSRGWALWQVSRHSAWPCYLLPTPGPAWLPEVSSPHRLCSPCCAGFGTA